MARSHANGHLMLTSGSVSNRYVRTDTYEPDLDHSHLRSLMKSKRERETERQREREVSAGKRSAANRLGATITSRNKAKGN